MEQRDMTILAAATSLAAITAHLACKGISLDSARIEHIEGDEPCIFLVVRSQSQVLAARDELGLAVYRCEPETYWRRGYWAGEFFGTRVRLRVEGELA